MVAAFSFGWFQLVGSAAVDSRSTSSQQMEHNRIIVLYSVSDSVNDSHIKVAHAQNYIERIEV